jgi:hypothetical protein
MADMLRAIGVGVQTVAGTPATVTWLADVEEFTHKPNITFDVPKFKTNTRWMERKVIAKTRYDEVTIRGRVDAVEFQLLLTSAFGTGVSGVYKAGGSNNKLLTVDWSEGLSGLMWQMIDARVQSLEVQYDAANGTIHYTIVLRGVGAAPATVVTPSYTAFPGDQPFGAWQGVFKRATTALCIHTFRFTVTNNVDPYYCSPLVDPTSSTEAGLYPSRFTEGEVLGTYDIVYEYLADAASSFYDFRHQISEAWHLKLVDPVTPSTVLWDFPILAGTSGELDRTHPNVLQHISGSILYDDTSATGVVVTFS